MATHQQELTRFADQAAWQSHLDQLGISAMRVTPDPICVATEGALWGSIQAHGLLREMVIVSDDAGQFDVGHHALCWVHAERLVHKLDTFTDLHRTAQQRMRALIWRFYDDLRCIARHPLRGAMANCVHASTASSTDAPDSSRSTVCSRGCTPTSQNC